ncbi:acyl-CoA reductase [Catenovulum maritimum]|uniref:Long-chain-fatty-acyl-CoA reductase n=1 Tax=Catenovulum maritimum TaxID=1513271 RepID=A0A0J8JPM7_9ALTE|nr:acyl-CoA reductase [Catenovulum maritimum]KMT66606.1 hypothetical protein XM47_03500 [Catenovulum maritimum]
MTHSLKFNELVNWHIKLTDAEKLTPWSDDLIDAVSGLADFIFKQLELRQYPEIIALAFWFRKTHLTEIKARVSSNPKICNDLNKDKLGQIFHIAPANVDTVFLYSALISVLSGNQNIVRISERSGDTTRLLIEVIKAYFNTELGKALKPYLAVVEYSALQSQVTTQFSQWCDMRVIWGGDNAIAAISDIAAETKQICFPDRYSVALMQLTAKTDISAVANAFLTDVLPFNQQACSSPKAIYWYKTKTDIQQQFWQKIQTLLTQAKHKLTISNKVEQHVLLQKLAMEYGLELADNSGKSFAKIQTIGPIGRTKVKKLTADMLISHTGNGLVLETDINELQAIEASQKLQTIVSNQTQLLDKLNLGLRKTDLGKALEFDTDWDGVDLLEAFNANDRI